MRAVLAAFLVSLCLVPTGRCDPLTCSGSNHAFMSAVLPTSNGCTADQYARISRALHVNYGAVTEAVVQVSDLQNLPTATPIQTLDSYIANMNSAGAVFLMTHGEDGTGEPMLEVWRPQDYSLAFLARVKFGVPRIQWTPRRRGL